MRSRPEVRLWERAATIALMVAALVAAAVTAVTGSGLAEVLATVFVLALAAIGFRIRRRASHEYWGE